MLLMEVVVPFLRVSRLNDLNPQEYNEAMIMELEALDGKRLQALDHIMIQKNKIASVKPMKILNLNFSKKKKRKGAKR